MEFPGHVGAALLAYAPIALVITVQWSLRLALVGALVTVALAPLPDLDEHASGMNHRGYVHTVGFAFAVGIACAGVFAVVGVRWFTLSTAWLATLGFVLGTTAILSHVIADALTPMGVAPFAPVSNRRYSFDVTPSANPAANRLFLVAGVGATLLAFAVGWFVR